MSSRLSRFKSRHSIHRLKHDLGWLLGAACILSLVGSLCSHFRVDLFYSDLASQFQPQYLLCGLSGLIIAMIRRDLFLGVVASLCLVSTLSLLVPYYFSPTAAEIPAGRTIKVFVGNVLTSNRNFAALADTIRKENPDFAVFVEVDSGWLQGLDPLRSILPFADLRPRDDNFGIAVFSRYPIEAFEELRVPGLETPTFRASVLVDGKPIQLIAAHPLPPFNMEATQLRDTQLQVLAEIVGRTATPTILAGDLNTSGWSVSGRKFLKNARLTEVRKGFGLLPTWPSSVGWFGLPLDHILHTKQFSTVACSKINIVGSDHAGLLAELRLMP